MEHFSKLHGLAFAAVEDSVHLPFALVADSIAALPKIRSEGLVNHIPQWRNNSTFFDKIGHVRAKLEMGTHLIDRKTISPQ